MGCRTTASGFASLTAPENGTLLGFRRMTLAFALQRNGLSSEPSDMVLWTSPGLSATLTLGLCRGTDVRSRIDNEAAVGRPRGIDRVLPDKKSGSATVDRHTEEVGDSVIVRCRGD